MPCRRGEQVFRYGGNHQKTLDAFQAKLLARSSTERGTLLCPKEIHQMKTALHKFHAGPQNQTFSDSRKPTIVFVDKLPKERLPREYRRPMSAQGLQQLD